MQLNAKVNLTQCRRAKLIIQKELHKGYVEEFGLLRFYANELLRRNQGSTAVLDTLRVTEVDKPKFKRIYICLKGCKVGFLKGCRPLIGIDGAFLKGMCKGELLTAVGRDGNNQMYPIAWAIVGVENTNNWLLFFQLLRDDLGLNDGAG